MGDPLNGWVTLYFFSTGGIAPDIYIYMYLNMPKMCVIVKYFIKRIAGMNILVYDSGEILVYVPNEILGCAIFYAISESRETI